MLTRHSSLLGKIFLKNIKIGLKIYNLAIPNIIFLSCRSIVFFLRINLKNIKNKKLPKSYLRYIWNTNQIYYDV